MKKQIKFIVVLASSLFIFNIAHANIVGMDTHNFNSTDDGMGFVTVKPSQPLDAGVFSVGYFINYATNSLPFFPLPSVTSAQKFAEPNDKLLSHDAHFAIGIMKGWDVGMNFPYVLSQDVDRDLNLGTFAATGMTEIRANTKVRIYNENDTGIALAASMSFPRINNNPFSGIDAGPTINVEAIFDMMLNKNWLWAVNVGYRIRDNGSTVTSYNGTPLTLIQVPITDQLIYSSALSYWMESWKMNWIFELFGSTPIEDVPTFTDRKVSNLEGLVGGKWQPWGPDFDLHAGLGTGVFYKGMANPDIRVYAGFNWRFGLWGTNSTPSEEDGDDDRDGVLNSRDKCPDSPPGAVVDRDGCSGDDDDRDGVPNRVDECPNTPAGDTVDEKGCSIVNKIQDTPVDGDDDNDGVFNSKDQCPDTPAGTQVNRLGCPPERVESIVLADLKFVYGKAQLTAASDKKLKANIQKLYPMRKKIQKILVEGHTDSKGRNEYNLELSKKRANTVKIKLIKYLKIDAGKVESQGYGEDQPIADNNSELGRAKNRRVEIQVIKEDTVFKGGEVINVE